jgi:hypothetical protein
LQIDILADVVLPITVNEVVAWEEPSPLVEMEVEGIALSTPTDMAKAWPGIWATAKAAKRMLERLKARMSGGRSNRPLFSSDYYTLEKRGLLGVLYRPASNKTRPVAAFFDPRMLPNPRAWLEKRLGHLPFFGHLVRRGEIAPIGSEVELKIDDRLVTVIKGEPAAEQPAAVYGALSKEARLYALGLLEAA